MTFKDAVAVFARTFAQLAGAALLAVQGYDWTSSDQIQNNGYILGLALLAAVIGSLIAAGWAFIGTPANTAVGKSVRSAIEKVIGGLGAVAFNSFADVVEFSRLIPSLLIAAVLAFAITYLSYVALPAAPPQQR